MQHVIHKQKSLAIAYDSSMVEAPSVDNFDIEFWKSKNALSGKAMGRGSAWFIDAPFGPVVLRQYLRGGWVAKISRRSYAFSTLSRSRPFMEYHLLAKLYDLGLPVPRPVAALCEHHLITSTGSLMTVQIRSAQTLADVITDHQTRTDTFGGLWESVGKCIRRFHQAGVWHADLNARNILLDAERNVYLIDFDRARFSPGKAIDGGGNLKRLKRSLTKFWPAGEAVTMQAAWIKLKAAYDG